MITYLCPITAAGLTPLAVTTRHVAYRLRVPAGTVTGLSLYLKAGSGYQGGTGGQLLVMLARDDDGVPGVPITYSLIADPAQDGLRSVALPPTILAAGVYWIVAVNLDQQPAENWVSLNQLMGEGGGVELWIKEPGEPWHADPRVPIAWLTYADKRAVGQGYTDALSSSKVLEIGGANRVRAVWTCTANTVRFSEMGLYVRHVRGQGPLSVAIRRVDGDAILDDGRIASGRVGKTYGLIRGLCEVQFVAGVQYAVELSAPEGTLYQTFPLVRGGPASLYGDGGRWDRDVGSGWVPQFGQDLQIQFVR